MRWQLASIFALFWILIGRLSFAQDAGLSECPQDSMQFASFEHDLKLVLSKPDPSAMALLVGYPLRVNDKSRGTILVESADAIVARFQEVFPSEVRASVINEKRNAAARCGGTGIMYGSGTVWVSVVGKGLASHYAVTTVNMPGNKAQAARGPKIEFICHADQQRVVIESDAKGVLRYQAWNKQRSVTERPDRVVTPGALRYEGSGVCAYPVWEFGSGNTSFSVSGLGCYSASTQPPDGARGALKITVEGSESVHSWCF